MSWESIVAIAIALIAAVPGLLSIISQRKSAAEGLTVSLINEMQEQLAILKSDLAAERKARLTLADELETERRARKKAEEKVDELGRELRVTRHALQEATEARQDRSQRITELESLVERLRGQVAELEGKQRTG